MPLQVLIVIVGCCYDKKNIICILLKLLCKKQNPVLDCNKLQETFTCLYHSFVKLPMFVIQFAKMFWKPFQENANGINI